MKPLSILQELNPQLHRLDDIFRHFDDFSGRDLDIFQGSHNNYNIVKNSDTTYSIEVSLPGLNIKDVSVEEKDNTLFITSKNKHPCSCDKDKDTNTKKFLHQGIKKESFALSFTLGDDVKIESAGMHNGLLNIQLSTKKTLENKARKIPITGYQ
jgi:HSP20 family molecular chaperone IbpA